MSIASDATAFAVECRRMSAWLSLVLGVDHIVTHTPIVSLQQSQAFGSQFFSSLSDGVVLCALMQKLRPGSIPTIHGSLGAPPKEVFRKRENIAFFLGALVDVAGLPARSVQRVEPADVIGCRSTVPLLSLLLDLANTHTTTTTCGELYPFQKAKFKASKADVAHAKELLAKYVPPSDLIGSVAASTLSDEQLARRARELAAAIGGDEARLRQLVRVQSHVRVLLAKRQFARMLRDRYFREKTARELLETEQSYQRGLDALNQFYVKRLKTAKDGGGRLLLTAEEHTVMFGGLLGLAEVSRDFAERLERRVNNWRSSSLIGDVLLKVADSLKLYSVYVKAFADADELLKRKLSGSKEFEQFLVQCQRDSGLALDLVSLLITPVQRLPRYELLLRELLQRTDAAHPDAELLRRALSAVSSVARYVNDRQRDADSQRTLADAQKRITLRPRDFVQPHRALVMEDDVAFGAKKDTRRLFLMSDLLVVARRLTRLERLKEDGSAGALLRYCDSLSMDTVRLRPIDSVSIELIGVSRFDVAEPPDAPPKEKALLVAFRNEAEMSTWLQRFDDVQRSAATAMLPDFPPPLLSDAERKALRKQYEEGDFVITPPIFNENATKAAKAQFLRQAEPAAQAVTLTRQHRTFDDSDGSSDADTAIFRPGQQQPQQQPPQPQPRDSDSDASSDSRDDDAPLSTSSASSPASRPQGNGGGGGDTGFGRRHSLRNSRSGRDGSPSLYDSRRGSLRGLSTTELVASPPGASASPDTKRHRRRHRSHIVAAMEPRSADLPTLARSPQRSSSQGSMELAGVSPAAVAAAAAAQDSASRQSSGRSTPTQLRRSQLVEPGTSPSPSDSTDKERDRETKRSRRRTSAAPLAALNVDDDRVSAKVEVTEYLGGYYDDVVDAAPPPESPTQQQQQQQQPQQPMIMLSPKSAPPIFVASPPLPALRGPPPVVPALDADVLAKAAAAPAAPRVAPKILAVEALSDSETTPRH